MTFPISDFSTLFYVTLFFCCAKLILQSCVALLKLCHSNDPNIIKQTFFFVHMINVSSISVASTTLYAEVVSPSW